MGYVKTFFRWLLGLLFIATGINHFWHPAFYVNIMPDYIPAHEIMVAASGVTELVAGVLLLIPRLAWMGAWAVIAMLLVFTTVHIHMIVHADRYTNVPTWALWLRLFLQAVFLLWAYWFTSPIPARNPANPEKG